MSARLGSVLLAIAALHGCGGSAPPTRYYRVDVAGDGTAAAEHAPVAETLVLRPVEVDEAYTDGRIAYRRGPHELRYYHYHRWASPVAEQVGAALQRGYEASGRFENVLRDESITEALVLEARVLRFEEVDAEPDQWLGHVVLRLHLKGPTTGAVLWSSRESERVPMEEQSPAGLAAALSQALQSIVHRTASELARHARSAPDDDR